MNKHDRAWRSILADIGRARTAQGRYRLGRFSIEGTRLHERALRAGVAVEVALTGESMAASSEERTRRLLADLESSGCAMHVVPDDVIAEITEGRDIGAIIGLVRLPAHRSIDQVLSACGQQRRLMLVAVDVEDPGNVGAMIRTALAASAAVFVAVGISDPYHPKAVRTSMGAVFRIPIVRHDTAQSLLESLDRQGVSTVGAVSRGGTAPNRLHLEVPSIAVFIGSEAFGLSKEVCADLDHLVSIPMSSEVDSFSANAAAAILLYALRAGA
jgi:TrmH family RNA methyltransferase